MRRDDGRKPLASPDRTSNTTQERRERGGQRRKLRRARAGAGSARSHHTHPARFGGGPGARARPGRRTEEQRRAPTAPDLHTPASRPGRGGLLLLPPTTRTRAARASQAPHYGSPLFPSGSTPPAARQAPTTHVRRRHNRPSPRRRRTGSGPAGRRSQPRSRDRPPGTADTADFSPRPRPTQAHATPKATSPGRGGWGAASSLPRLHAENEARTPLNPPRRREARHLRRARPRRAAWKRRAGSRPGQSRPAAGAFRPTDVDTGPSGERHRRWAGACRPSATAEARALAGAERGRAEERSAATEARRHGGRRRSADSPPPPERRRWRSHAGDAP